MNIEKSTSAYEHWLAGFMPIVSADLEFKHEQMALAAFPFFRATYYRWAQIWGEFSGGADTAPKVLSVGDLHVENFGTWRDSEGRLIWGVNDFDEVTHLPYTNDLIRLGTSIILAAEERDSPMDLHDALDSALAGYEKCLREGGKPFVLAEHHPDLRRAATGELRDPVHFWAKASTWPLAQEKLDLETQKAAVASMPGEATAVVLKTRRAGLGSLGRPRFVLVATADAGSIAREVKALAPSAALWAAGVESGPILYQSALDSPHRGKDPFTRIYNRWLIRRLAPDCSRIELADLPKDHDRLKLIAEMGYETANLHLSTPGARANIVDHLRHQPKKWLFHAARDLAAEVEKEFGEWKRSF